MDWTTIRTTRIDKQKNDTLSKYLREQQDLFPDGYELSPITQANFEDAVQVISEVMPRQPLMNNEVTAKSYSSFIREMLKVVMHFGYCFVLLHKEQICSFVLASDFLSPPSGDVVEYILWSNSSNWEQVEYERVLSIRLLIKSLVEQYKDRVLPATKDRHFHVLMGGTQIGFEGIGIGLHMRMAAVNIAKSFGFKYLVAEAFNPVTARIWRDKLHGEVLATINVSKDTSKELASQYEHLGDDYTVQAIRVKL